MLQDCGQVEDKATFEDDQGIDPVTGTSIIYESDWATGPDCTTCTSHPDATLAYDGTWHDTTYKEGDPVSFVRNATFNFTGVRIRFM